VACVSCFCCSCFTQTILFGKPCAVCSHSVFPPCKFFLFEVV
jgi:hypothetical protein